MSILHAECAQIVRQLFESLSKLENDSSLLQLDSLAGMEWFELLKTKLLPQLQDDGFLVDAWPGQSIRVICGPLKRDFPDVLQPGTWQHVAVVLGKGRISVYLDGKEL